MINEVKTKKISKYFSLPTNIRRTKRNFFLSGKKRKDDEYYYFSIA